MFCKNCGKELSDTAKFCGVCGASVPTAPAAEEKVNDQLYQPEPPAVDPGYTNCPPTTVTLEPRLSRGKYIWKKAPGGIKASAVAGTVVGILCIVICVAMFVQFFLGSMLEYPIVKMVDADLEFDQSSFENELESLEFQYDRLNEELKSQPDSDEKKELEREMEYVDALICKMECTIDTPSIYNLFMLANVMEEAADELEDSVEYDEESIEEAVDASNNIVLVFGGYGLFILLLTLLAVIFRNNFLTVPALILGVAFPFFFSGVIYGVLFVVGYVTLFILNIEVNSSYRKYKREYKKAVA